MKEFKGIDISKHNKIVSFDAAARSVDFMILRAGGNFGGYYKDSKFEAYYNGTRNYNIPCGCYYDAGKEFIGAEKGYEYAQHFMQLMSGKVFEYPVFLDIEVTPRQYKKYITDAAVVFCRELENKGYFAGIYASDISGFKDLLSIERVAPFCKWVARYGNKPSYVKSYAIWQHSSKGSIPGISGPVDLDISYKNFPKIIKGGHFNGY